MTFFASQVRGQSVADVLGASIVISDGDDEVCQYAGEECRRACQRPPMGNMVSLTRACCYRMPSDCFHADRPRFSDSLKKITIRQSFLTRISASSSNACSFWVSMLPN